MRNLTDVTRSMWEGASRIVAPPLPHVFCVVQSIGFKQCCSELFIVNPLSVQLFSPNCSFLFAPEPRFQGISLWIKHLLRLARNSL
ncbi:hypothetical protein DENIT_60547 [Pseudomonas veronii]|nr:hypothetical protein DENIT_60547 [Pseudomonas veronii]